MDGFILKKMNYIDNRNNLGFTIVELLVVIVIIGILAAITVVGYTGITKKANEASLQSDLASNSKKLDMYRAQYDGYPHINSSTGCPEAPSVPDDNYCLKFSSGNTFEYIYKTPSNYELRATKDITTFSVSESKAPALAQSCPSGFIVVPGSATYGTGDFCVMKYEAKADDNGDGIGDINQTTGYNTWPADTYPISASRKLVSTPVGYPVANISQSVAIAAAQNFTKDCVGCHLISEAEWMTIAQNVLSVGSNWSSGTVGSGFMYQGHINNDPASSIEASDNDDNGTYGETVSGVVAGSNTKRTLMLSNGNVIWDLSGNVLEWSAGQTSSSQPGITGGGWGWREYNSLNNVGTLSINVTPAGTAISNSSSWTSSNGIGQIYSNASNVSSRGFLRGGDWYSDTHPGVLSLNLVTAPTALYYYLGFRVAAPTI